MHIAPANLSLVHRGLLAAFVPVVVQSCLLCCLNFRQQEDTALSNRMMEVSFLINDGYRLSGCLATCASYLQEYNLTGDSSRLENFKSASAKLRSFSDQLAARVDVLPSLSSGERLLFKRSAEGVRRMQELLATDLVLSTSDRAAAESMWTRQGIGSSCYEVIEQFDVHLRQQERWLNEAKKAQDQQNRLLTVLSSAVLVLNLLAALLISSSFTLGIARKISSLKDEASRHSDGSLLLNEEPGQPEEIRQLNEAIYKLKDTQLKLLDSEARWTVLIDSLPIGVIVLDEKWRIEAANSSFRKVFNFPSGRLMGKKVDEVLRGFSCEHLSVAEPVSPASAGTENAFECLILDGAGNKVDIAVVAARVAMPEGIRLMLSIENVSSRKALERLKQDFIAMITHDLRTPLTSIQLFQQLLKSGALGDLPDSAEEPLAAAERSVGRMLRLTGDLLDIERISAGEFRLVSCETSAATIVQRSTEVVMPLASQRGIKIVSSTEALLDKESAGASMMADEARIVQVMVNLLANAIKFSPVGSTIAIDVNQPTVDVVEIGVTDCGCGIAVEQQQIIFQRYKQVEPDGTPKRQGVGLGLAICKEIVELHEGKIGVSSAPGAGSRFWIRLPVNGQQNQVLNAIMAERV